MFNLELSLTMEGDQVDLTFVAVLYMKSDRHKRGFVGRKVYSSEHARHLPLATNVRTHMVKHAVSWLIIELLSHDRHLLQSVFTVTCPLYVSTHTHDSVIVAVVRQVNSAVNTVTTSHTT